MIRIVSRRIFIRRFHVNRLPVNLQFPQFQKFLRAFLGFKFHEPVAFVASFPRVRDQFRRHVFRVFVFEESRHSLFVHDVRRDAADEDRSFRIANLRGVVRCRIGNRIFRGVLVVFFESSGARRERRLDDFRFSRRRLLLLLLALLLLPLLFLAATR